MGEAAENRRTAGWGALELALFLALYLAVRGALVLSLGDVFFYGEELAKAAAARALGSRVDLAWHELPYIAYEGGGFVFSHLDRLAFALCGESLLALKLVPLAWGAAILIASWRLCDLLFGRASARVFAMLLVFAPAAFQKLSLLSLGIHFEALLFVALILGLSARIAFERDDRKLTWFLLGLSAGFGAYFSYSTLPTTLYAGLAIAILRPSALRPRAVLSLLAGFALGAAPLAWMAAHVGREVWTVHGEELLGAGAARRLGELLSTHARAILEGRGAFELAAMLALPAIVLIGFAQVAHNRARPERDHRWLFIAGYLLLFLGVYLFSGFAEKSLEHAFHLKRLSQVWYLASLLAAAVIPPWIASPRRTLRVAGLAAASALVISGAIDAFTIARAGRPHSLAESWRVLTSTKGYVWTSYVRSLEPRIAGDAAHNLRVLVQLSESEHTWLYPVLSDQVWTRSRPEFDEVVRICREVGGADWQAFLPGLGTYWRRVHGPDIRVRTRTARELPADLAPFIVEAIGRDAVGPRVTEEVLRAEIARGLDKEMPDEFFAGVGARVPECLGEESAPCALARSARPWILHRELAEQFIAGFDPRIAALLRRGCEQGYALRTLR